MPPRKVSEAATQFAKDYVELTEALIQQGVPEDLARQEARATALSMMYGREELAYDPADGPCPICGRG